MTDWPAYVEDALAFWFARGQGCALGSVSIFERLDERVVLSWSFVARAPGTHSTIDIADEIPWIQSGDRIGQWEIHVPDLFDALDLHQSDIGECQRSDCESEAERYVLYTSAISDEAHTSADNATAEVCERHEPSVCPFHSTGQLSSSPAFGWRPGQ